MAVNRYAKKIQTKNRQAENQTANVLKDMSSYLNDKTISNGEIEQIPLSQIKINPINDYRQLDSDEDIEVLADDIKRNGILHNLVVSKRGAAEYVLLSGERRFRALNLLLEKEIEKQKNGDTDADVGKYRQVQCRVIKNLTERKEQIILDAANLQTRGGAGNEKITRMAMERYRDNVKAEYGLTDTQAKELILKISNIGRSNIYRNIKIIDNLIPELTQKLNHSEISKKEADAFVKLTTEQQNSVNGIISYVKETFEKDKDVYIKIKTDTLKSLLQACEEKTDKNITQAIEKVNLNILKEKEKYNNLSNTEKTVKTVHQQSYREKVIKDCQDIQTKIEKLKKKKVDVIREIDKSANLEDETIVSYVDNLIKELQAFRNEITEGEIDG